MCLGSVTPGTTCSSAPASGIDHLPILAALAPILAVCTLPSNAATIMSSTAEDTPSTSSAITRLIAPGFYQVVCFCSFLLLFSRNTTCSISLILVLFKPVLVNMAYVLGSKYLLYIKRKLQSTSQLTRWSCNNIGGYFDSSGIHSANSTTADTTALATTAPGVCYYDTWQCPGYDYAGQCYSDRSSTYSCSTCDNIGGTFTDDRDGQWCYYYFNDCAFLSAGEQCHTSRYSERLHGRRVSIVKGQVS